MFDINIILDLQKQYDCEKFSQLYNYYYRNLKGHMINIIHKKFPNVLNASVDDNEYDYLLFESLMDAIKYFKVTTNSNFEFLLFRINHCCIVRNFSRDIFKNIEKDNIVEKKILSDNKPTYIFDDESERNNENKENDDKIIIIDRYINNMPLITQHVINMRRQGLNNRDIAKKLNIPVKKVYNIYSKFIINFRRDHNIQ